MEYCKRKLMKDAYKRYLKSDKYDLYDCYKNWSLYKRRAYEYCNELSYQYESQWSSKIINYNLFTFTYGFIGKINGKDAFFYITKDYDRYIYLEDLED